MANEYNEKDAESLVRAVRHPHIPGMWCYRVTNPTCQGLRIGGLGFAEGGSPVCAIADIVDVKPEKVLAFLQEKGFVTTDAGVVAEGVPAAIEHFGGSVVTTDAAGIQAVVDVASLEALRAHVLGGNPAVVCLGDSGGAGTAVAVAGYDAARQEVLLFDPRGAELDGWYSWAWLARKAKAFVLATLPEEDHYSPRYIFKCIYGVDIAGCEQRWPDIDLAALQKVNPDCIGWIHLGGTPLSYPIVKDHLEITYYQSHNLSGETSIHGAVALSFENGGTFDGPNLVFSAHRMKDYSMFKMLTFYDRPDWSAENPCFDLLLGAQLYSARVFSAYHFPKGQNGPDPFKVEFDDHAAFERWVDQRVDLSMHPFPPPGQGTVATFRTCYGMENDKMFVVHAVLERAANG